MATNEDKPITGQPVATHINADSKTLGVDEVGNVVLYPLSLLTRNNIGVFKTTDATPATPLLNQSLELIGTGSGNTPSGTYTNLKGVGNVAIVIPAAATGHAIINAKAVWNGLYWVPQWQDVVMPTVDLAPYAQSADVLSTIKTGLVTDNITQLLTQKNYNSVGTVQAAAYTSANTSAGKKFTTALTADSDKAFFDTGVAFSIPDGGSIKAIFKCDTFVSALPCFGIGWGTLDAPVCFVYRSSGGFLRTTPTLADAVAGGGSPYAYAVGVTCFLEIRRTGALYELRASNGVSTTPWTAIDSPTGNLLIGMRGGVIVTASLSYNVDFGNTASIKAYTDGLAALKVDKSTLKSNVSAVMYDQPDTNLLTQFPYVGYSLRGTSDVGVVASFTQTHSVSGLSVAFSGLTSALNSIQVSEIAWDGKDAVSLQTTIGTLTGAPGLSLGYGNPRAAGGGYKCIMYRADGSVFGITIDSAGNKNLDSLILKRGVSSGFAYAQGDVISIKMDIRSQQIICSKNGVNQPAIPFLTALAPSGSVYITSRDNLNIVDASLTVVTPGILAPVTNNLGNLNNSVTALNTSTGNIQQDIFDIKNTITDGTTSFLRTYFDTDIVHIMMYGQSLSIGTKSRPALTISQKYNSLMFQGGLRKFYDEEAAGAPIANFYASFQPLVEYNSGVDYGETPLSGMFDAMHECLIKRGVDYVTNNDVQFLGTAPGHGGRPIASLVKGTEWYNGLINEVVQGMAVANALGKTYSVPFICWNQGESDIDSGTTIGAYKAALIGLQQDLNNDIKAITGQSKNVTIVMYQTASHNVRTPPVGYYRANIALAQLELALDDAYPNIIMSNTSYFLDYNSDNIHFNNMSSKLNGVCHGVSVLKHLEQGAFKPIHVEASFFQSKIIELRMVAPSGKLVFDTVNVTAIGNNGFRVFDAGDVEQAIISVTILRGNTVRIITSANVSAGWYVTYAINGNTTGKMDGSRGNLRDSNNYTFDPTNTNKAVYNWCPIFKRVL